MVRRLGVTRVLVGAFLAASWLVWQAAAAPLDEQGLVKLLELQIGDPAIVAKIDRDGLGFPLDEQVRERLKQAGASEQVLDAASKAAAARPSPTPAITCADVHKLLELGIGEDSILKRLGGTTLVLDARQEADLRKAGASDRLIAAMGRVRQTPTPGPAGEAANWAVIFDCSASMKEMTTGGMSKMEVAKKEVTALLQSMPDGLSTAFVIYGHDKQLACQAVEVVQPLGSLDQAGKSHLAEVIRGLQPVGNTPIALALEAAASELAKRSAPGGVVLITDGKDTCGRDPVEVARAMNLAHGVNVVGFAVSEEERRAVQAIADAGKGKYYDARSGADLLQQMKAVQVKVEQTARTDSAVVSTKRPSTDAKSPVPLTLREIVTGRLGISSETGKGHFWLVDLPPGSYKIVLDVKRADNVIAVGPSGWVGGDLDWFSLDGEEVGAAGSDWAEDFRYRIVCRFKTEQPLKRVLRYWNEYTISDYHLGIFPVLEPVKTPFFSKCPRVQSIEVGQPMTASLDGSRSFSCDAFYSRTLAPGDYRVKAEFNHAANQEGRLGGSVKAYDCDGGWKGEILSTFNEGKSPATESAKLCLADETVIIFRVRAYYAGQLITFTVEPWPEEQ